MHLRRLELHHHTILYNESFIRAGCTLADQRGEQVTDRALDSSSKGCHVQWVRTAGPHLRQHGKNHPHGSTDFERLGRSEEHTSELQSRLHLVCRLLLEKKV